MTNQFLKDANVELPIVCGAMYPCSNGELVAAVSQHGGLGIIQPLSMVYVYDFDFREGLKHIKSLTAKPVGLNVIVEKSSKKYELRMKEWVDIAIDEGVRFFVTSLGNPEWVVKAAHAVGGKVYHTATEKKWAEKALAKGVDGLIAVNSNAGGHAGAKDPESLYRELSSLGVPVICAGGVGSPAEFAEVMSLGYEGVQMGTRFIAAKECKAHNDYKDAIIEAKAKDIVLTDKISGVPVAVIKTPYIEKIGAKASPLAKLLLKNARTKHYMRLFYTLKSIVQLKKASLKGMNYKDFFQAGRSVEKIDRIETVEEILVSFAKAIQK